MINNSEFGAVEAGSLTLQGRLQIASWRLPGAENVDWSFRVQYRQKGALYRSHNSDLKDQLKGATMYLDAFFNDLTAEKFPISVHLMIVGRTSLKGIKMQNQNERIVGLVLKRESATEYKRFGTFEFSLETTRRNDLDWLNSGDVQTITIV
jgi:hypothetical protein